MDIYTKEIYNFLKTITVKSSFIADQYKDRYMKLHNLSDLPDERNPYYLHMCGMYSEFDIASSNYIQVESIDSNDSGETIILDRNSINTHPRTTESYKLPNPKFEELCLRYPKKEHLIESILYPVSDLNTAITAQNFTILNYDGSLLQDNERDSLIQCITDVVAIFKTQLYIEEFLYEDMYPVILWDCMWKMLYLFLYIQRIKNIRTPSVHVSHIWYYLSSKGLGDYRSVLNFKQQYWLYRNIDYLIRNKGKNNNIQLLAENVLKPYSVELKQKSFLLNYRDGIDTATPIIETISEDLYSSSTPTMDTGDVFESLPDILKLELNNGLRKTNTADTLARVSETITRTVSTYHPTRIVEIDKKPVWPDYYSLYAKFTMDNYLYRYTLGDLNYKIITNMPGLGVSKTLTIGEACALLNYCFFIQVNRSSDDVEDLITNPIVIDNPITQEELTPGWIRNEPLVPINIPTAVEIETVFTKGYIPSNVKMVFDGIPYAYVENYLPNVINIPDLNYSSPEEYMEFSDNQFDILYKTSLVQRNSASTFLYRAIDAVYQPFVLKGRLPVTFVEGHTTYAGWFDANPDLKGVVDSLLVCSNIELETFMIHLSDSMFPTEKSYNIVRSSITLNEKYNKLKQLFIYLCSYSIGFIDTQNDDQINLLTHANVLHVSNEIDWDVFIHIPDDITIENAVTSEMSMTYDSVVDVFVEGTSDISLSYETDLLFESESSPTVYIVRPDERMGMEFDIVSTNININLLNNTTTMNDFYIG